jgi:KamA family protein
MPWKEELKKNLRGVEDLLPYLSLTEAQKRQMAQILDVFPLAITPYYLSLIDFSDPKDPIRKMAIPSLAETDLSGSFDTSGEASNTVVEGLQHKYPQTAMVLSTNQCAMYCRHCFRKRFVGLSDDEIATHFDEMHNYILEHKEISNVLISGGDSLLNSNARLKNLLSLLVDIEHLEAIRLGTRVPVVFPQRITKDGELPAMLAGFNKKKQLYLVTQYNHPRELTPESIASIRKIQSAGIPVKNQTVLLRGVNDDPPVLGALLEKMVSFGISPYYIFQCRPVAAVKNRFQVPLKKAVKIVEDAKAMQNGMGKNFKFCMSHVTGKLEILGMINDNEILFKYHECPDKEKLGAMFTRQISDAQAWIKE